MLIRWLIGHQSFAMHLTIGMLGLLCLWVGMVTSSSVVERIVVGIATWLHRMARESFLPGVLMDGPRSGRPQWRQRLGTALVREGCALSSWRRKVRLSRLLRRCGMS